MLSALYIAFIRKLDAAYDGPDGGGGNERGMALSGCGTYVVEYVYDGSERASEAASASEALFVSWVNYCLNGSWYSLSLSYVGVIEVGMASMNAMFPDPH